MLSPLLMLSLTSWGVRDDLVSRRLGYDVQRLKDRDTRPQQEAERASEARHRDLLEEVAEHGDLELDPVDAKARAVVRRAHALVRDGASDGEHDERRQDDLHLLAQRHEDLRRERQLTAEVGEHLGEGRNDEQQHHDD